MLRRLTLRPLASLSPAFPPRSLPGGLTAAAPHGGTQSPPLPLRFSIRGFLDIHKLGSKEAIEREKERLKDEINRGYFADIKEFNAHGGKEAPATADVSSFPTCFSRQKAFCSVAIHDSKRQGIYQMVAMANKTIIPSVAAVKFPELEVNFSDGRSMTLPFDSNCSNVANASPALICMSFRASSQAMIESWSIPFLDAFNTCGNVQIFEVSFIESWILSLGPVKRLMLRVMNKPKNPSRQTVYSFGDRYYLRKKLHIVNLLTGYVFLLDNYGRIRWQGFGFATAEELATLISCTQLLISEK